MNRFDFSKFDTMSKDAVAKMEEMINLSRLNDFLNKREEEEKQKNCILWILAIIGAVYRFFTPDYLEDFEDDFEDEFDDDFFEDEEIIPVKAEVKEEA